MTTLYKAVRPDGTDFYMGTIQWAPPADHESEWIVRHPNGEREPGAHPYTFLSVADAPADCIGMEWPCRLLTVEPVEGYPTACPDREEIPHRVAATAWRVTGERPAHEVFGPQGEHVVCLLDNLAGVARGTIKVDAWDAASDTIEDTTLDTVLDAAWDAARDAARGAAWDAAWGAIWDAASDTVWDAAWEAIWGAAAALVARDLIPRETYDILTRPVRLAGITVHPDDPDLKKEN